MYLASWDHESQPQTITVLLRWAVSDRELIHERAFQTIFAGAIRIRHGGAEESVDAVWRQISVPFPMSADIPDYESSQPKGFALAMPAVPRPRDDRSSITLCHC